MRKQQDLRIAAKRREGHANNYQLRFASDSPKRGRGAPFLSEQRAIRRIVKLYTFELLGTAPAPPFSPVKPGARNSPKIVRWAGVFWQSVLKIEGSLGNLPIQQLWLDLLGQYESTTLGTLMNLTRRRYDLFRTDSETIWSKQLGR